MESEFEMEVLEYFLGKWASSVSIKNADGTSHSYDTSNEFSYLAGNEFIQDKAIAPDGESGHLGIWHYDPETQI